MSFLLSTFCFRPADPLPVFEDKHIGRYNQQAY
jgi:hypothetical protein